MLHMQHAHVVAQLVRRHEAALLKAQRDAAAEARRAAAATGAAELEALPAAAPRAPKLDRARTA